MLQLIFSVGDLMYHVWRLITYGLENLGIHVWESEYVLHDYLFFTWAYVAKVNVPSI
jgi:hypothetical protein